MKKREYAEKLSREIAKNLNIEEVYDNTDDIELDKLINRYVNNRITEKDYIAQVSELIKCYKDMYLERVEYDT